MLNKQIVVNNNNKGGKCPGVEAKGINKKDKGKRKEKSSTSVYFLTRGCTIKVPFFWCVDPDHWCFWWGKRVYNSRASSHPLGGKSGNDKSKEYIEVRIGVRIPKLQCLCDSHTTIQPNTNRWGLYTDVNGLYVAADCQLMVHVSTQVAGCW